MGRLIRMFLFALCTSSLLWWNASCQEDRNVENIISQIFDMDTAQPPRRTGFDVIVTPVPPNGQQPQSFESITGRGACNCVPYHMCDPSSNSVTQDGEFDEFLAIDLRIDSNNPVCPDVLDVCCDTNRARNMSLTPTPLESRPFRARGCGVQNPGGIDFNITGAVNYEAGFGEFPWTVALLNTNNNSYFCAGSLIHPNVVLTAVHCVLNRSPFSITIRAGEWDSQTTKERLPFQERTVSRIINHPQYNPRNAAYDFSLLILSSSVTLSDHINTVCLPNISTPPVPGIICRATGWGKDVFGAAGRYSAIMKHIPLPIVDFLNCQDQFRRTRLGPSFVLDRSFICAGGERGIDTCQGDGGAPLFCPIGNPSDNRFEQSGIVAWGIGCNQEIPAAYANVALVRGWIDNQMLSNGFDTRSYSVI